MKLQNQGITKALFFLHNDSHVDIELVMATRIISMATTPLVLVPTTSSDERMYLCTLFAHLFYRSECLGMGFFSPLPVNYLALQVPSDFKRTQVISNLFRLARLAYLQSNPSLKKQDLSFPLLASSLPRCQQIQNTGKKMLSSTEPFRENQTRYLHGNTNLTLLLYMAVVQLKHYTFLYA